MTSAGAGAGGQGGADAAQDQSWYQKVPWAAGATIVGVIATLGVSLLSLQESTHTAEKQAALQLQLAQTQSKLQSQLAAQSLSATAPSTKVVFVSSDIDPDGSGVELHLSVEGVGTEPGYGCTLSDVEQITNGDQDPGQGQAKGELTTATGGPLADYSSDPGHSQALSVRYPQSVDGIIQIAISAPCGTPDSTTQGVTVTVLSVAGKITAPVKFSPTPAPA